MRVTINVWRFSYVYPYSLGKGAEYGPYELYIFAGDQGFKLTAGVPALGKLKATCLDIAHIPIVIRATNTQRCYDLAHICEKAYLVSLFQDQVHSGFTS